MDDTFIRKLAEKELADVDIDMLMEVYLSQHDDPDMNRDDFIEWYIEMIMDDIENRDRSST